MSKHKPRIPTVHQSRVLQQIAGAGGALILTYDNENHQQRYSDQAGRTIATPTARILIDARWVKPEQDGLWDQPQSWRVRTL